MKKLIKMFCVLALVAGFSVPSFSANGPVDPARPGTGIIGFGFGPGVPYWGSNGVGPAFLFHYDHSIWQAGPGVISLGGQIGTSFFTDNSSDWDRSWTHTAFVFRGAYHYGWKVPGLDTYAGFGAGPRVSFYNGNHNGDDYNDTEFGFTPTSFLGGSYFFNHTFGVNAEMGFNLAYFSVGLNFRIVK